MGLRAAYEATSERMPGVSFDDFCRAIDGCEFHDVYVCGKDVGAVIVIGNEIHACIKHDAKGRWMSRSMLRVLDDVVKRYGAAVTSATTAEGERFVCRLGFVKRGDMWEKRAHHGN